MITCINVPRNSNSIIAHDVIKDGKKMNMSLNDMIELIEFELLDIVDILVKDALRNYTGDYYVLGGKSLNNLYKPSVRGITSRSFDFDIHVREHVDINKLSKFIADDTNVTLNQHWKLPYKHQIFRKLKKLNLVDASNLNYYVNNTLFYYGTRQRRTGPIKVPSVFIRFQFRPTLFSYKNINNYLYSNISKNYDIVKQYTQNDVYLPIIDIDTDDDLNIGVKVLQSGINDPIAFQNSIYYSSTDGINYADLYVSTFNLARLIAMGQKLDKNIKKFKNVFNFANYSCDILSTYEQTYSFNHLNNIRPQVITNADITLNDDSIIYGSMNDINGKIIISGTNYLDTQWKYFEILQDVYNKINIGRSSRTCDPIYSPTKPVSDIKYIFEGLNFTDTNKFKNELAFAAYDTDRKYEHIVYVYTTNDIYININLYNIYVNNGLTIDWTLPSWKSTIKFNNNTKNFSTNVVDFTINQSILNDNISYDNACNLLDGSIIEYHKNLRLNKTILDKIPDEFEVITFQQIVNFDLDGSGISNVTDLVPGDMILYPQYISTTFSTQSNLSYFAFYNRTILKIKLSKKSNSWMILGPYSQSSSENEVFIGRNNYFVVTDISTVIADINSTNIEYRLISLTLCNKPQIAINTSLTIKNDIVFKSPLFIYAANYAYDNHLSKSYSETNLSKICPGLGFDWDAVMNVNVNNQSKNIYRYNHGLNHSLRVASFIQLYGLIIKSKLRDMNDVYDMISTDLLWKASIAAIFMVTGRESEASFVTACSALPVGKKHPYIRYLNASARNFVSFAESIKGLNIFTNEDILLFTDIISDYYNIYTSSENLTDIKIFIAHLFTYAHALDLIRCKNPDEYSVCVPNCIDTPDEISMYLTILSKVVIDIMDITGDRIMGSNIVNKSYDKVKFYKCSSDPSYCIGEISIVVSPIIEELLADIKTFEDSKKPPITPHIIEKEIIIEKQYFPIIDNGNTQINIRNDRLIDTVLENNTNLTTQIKPPDINSEDIDCDNLIEYAEARNIGARMFTPYNRSLVADIMRDNTILIDPKYIVKSIVPVNTCTLFEHDIIGRNDPCASKNMYAYAASVYEILMLYLDANTQIYTKTINVSILPEAYEIVNISDIIQSTEKRIMHRNSVGNAISNSSSRALSLLATDKSNDIQKNINMPETYKFSTLNKILPSKQNSDNMKSPIIAAMAAGSLQLTNNISNLQRYNTSKYDYYNLTNMFV
jgi:hypothetical protein